MGDGQRGFRSCLSLSLLYLVNVCALASLLPLLLEIVNSFIEYYCSSSLIHIVLHCSESPSSLLCDSHLFVPKALTQIAEDGAR